MSLALLIDLTVRGSLVLCAAMLADFLFARSIHARWRRVWWLLVPLSFLVPVSFRPSSSIPITSYTIPGETSDTAVHVLLPPHLPFPVTPLSHPASDWITLVWLVGALIAALRILIATWRVRQQWRERFSTDPALLNLLEDNKAVAGVTAPIGLIVSERINAPALLGWLRPRILLPAHLATGGASDLRAVLLHELAHFKSLDIPCNWLFAAIRIVHWFNPLAYLASSGWTRFIEEAADENAIRWLAPANGTDYGEILLKTLASCPPGPAPYGALAIGESIATLKRRIIMIRHHHTKSSRGWVAAAVVLIIGFLLALAPTLAVGDDDPAVAKKAATDAMQSWLTEIDAGDYAKSWSDSAQFFQKAITSDKWTSAVTSVRTPLGKLVTRKLDSVAVQTMPPGKEPVGDVAIAQFDSSFENMKYARETVSFQKESDGGWRAVGYYIKPQ